MRVNLRGLGVFRPVGTCRTLRYFWDCLAEEWGDAPWGMGYFFVGRSSMALACAEVEMACGLLGQLAEVKSEADQLPFGLNFF